MCVIHTIVYWQHKSTIRKWINFDEFDDNLFACVVIVTHILNIKLGFVDIIRNHNPTYDEHAYKFINKNLVQSQIYKDF